MVILMCVIWILIIDNQWSGIFHQVCFSQRHDFFPGFVRIFNGIPENM